MLPRKNPLVVPSYKTLSVPEWVSCHNRDSGAKIREVSFLGRTHGRTGISVIFWGSSAPLDSFNFNFRFILTKLKTKLG